MGTHQATLGLHFSSSVALDARSLIHPSTTIFGRSGQGLVNLLLAHDGVARPTETTVGEKIMDVSQSAGPLVDVIIAVTRSVELAGDGDFRAVNRESTVFVIEDESDLGKTNRLAVGAA